VVLEADFRMVGSPRRGDTAPFRRGIALIPGL
jgi:hypothetical protein